MTEKTFTFDLGKIMDEAFRVAESFGEAFGEKVAEGFPSAEEMREHFRDKFKWHSYGDFYPYYSYPPMNIFLNRDKSLVFEIALAGFEEKDIDLQFKGDYLHFSAKAPAAAEEQEGIQYFKRRLKLKSIDEQRYYVPEDKFDRGRVEARFNDGLLRVVIPSREEEKDRQGIKVRIVTEESKPGKPGGSPSAGAEAGKTSAAGGSAKTGRPGGKPSAPGSSSKSQESK
ncbi:MAG: Hsp20/alpha crystallin family protein [Spirochaetales bacterium]|nr:Hsp20/alpha crystallin family protein [Spirochaetales bacterium]